MGLIKKKIPSFDEVMGQTPTEDPKPKAIPSFDEVMGVKKKVSGVASSPSSLPSSSPFGEGIPATKAFTENKASFDKAMGMADAAEDDPLGTVLHPVKESASKLYTNAQKALDRSRSETTGQQTLSAANKEKVRLSREASDIDALGKYSKIKENVENELIPDADVATKALVPFAKAKGIDIPLSADGVADVNEAVLSKLPKDNETVKAIVKKIDDYKQAKTDLDESGGRVQEALIARYAKQNPHFAEQLSKMQDEYGNNIQDAIPEVVRGKIIADGLNDPNVKLAASKDPYTQKEYDNLQQNLLTLYPEYGAKVVGNELSVARENAGENNALANLPRQKYMDQLAQKMYAVDPQKLQIYQNIVSKDLPSYIDAPGILEHAAGGVKHTVSGQLNSLAQLVGLKSVGENTYDELKDQYGQVSAQGKGLHSITPIVGDMGGMLATMAVSGGLLRGTGLANNASQANAVNTILTFYGTEKQKADALFPDDPNKSTLRAGLMTAAFTQLHNLFPTSKIQSALKSFSPEADRIVNDLVEGKISKAAARDATTNAFKDAIHFSGDVAKQSAKAGGEMMAVTLLGQVTDKVLNLDSRKYHEIHNDRELIDAAKLGAIGSFAPHLLTQFGQRSAVKNSLYDIANNPERFKGVLEFQRFTDPNIEKSINDSKGLISELGETKKLLDERGVPTKLQKSYILQTVNERMLTAKAEATTEPVLKKKYQDQIKASQEAKQKILKGEDKDILPQEINTDKLDEHTKFLKELFDGDEGVSFLKKADQDMLGGKKFDKDKVADYLEFVATQSNNLVKNENGEWVPDEKFDSRKAAEDRFDKQIVDAANEMYPQFKKLGDEQGAFQKEINENPKTDSRISVIQPGEIPQPEIITIAPKEFTAEPKPKGPSIILPKQGASETPTTQRVEETPIINEQGKAEGQINEPPTPVETGKTTEGAGEEIRLSHADTKKIYDEAKLPGRLETPNKKDTELVEKADKMVRDGYDFDGESDKVMRGEKNSFTDEEQVAFAKAVAALKAKAEGLDVKSPEFEALQQKIEKYSRASDVVGTLEGRALRARQTFVPKEDTLSDFIMTEKANVNTDILTDAQKEKVQQEYKETKEAEKAWADKYAKLEEENSRLLAEKEIAKTSASKKPAKKNFKEERAQIFTDIKEKLRKARGELNSAPIPYAKELFVIAPDVAKLVKNLVEDGVTKLSEIVKQVHAQLKEDVPDIQEKDIMDIIAGKYNEKRPTKSQVAIAMQDLKIQATLIDKLARLEAGEEVKSEKQQRKQNKEITDLRERVAKFSQEKADAIRKEAEDIKAAKKAKIEADKAEERFAREFEKEKDSEAKQAAKAKVQEAKELATDLDKKTKEESALNAIKGRYQKQIKKLEEQIQAGDYGPDTKPEPIKLDKEALELKDKLIKVKNDRKFRQLKEFYNNQSKYEKGVRMAANIMNVPRALMSTLDYSALLRQALIPVVANPTMGGKAAKEMFKSSFSQKHYDRWINELQESKRYEDMKKSKLALTDSTSLDVQAREEVFMSNLVDRVPGLGALTKGSERAYSMLLNKMRADLYNRFADAMEQRGLTVDNSPEQYKQMAAYINNATGRGDLGKTLNNAAPLLNALFFSPRLIASRVNMLTYFAQPRFYKTVPKEVRQAYFKDMAKFIGLGLTVLALAKLGGAEVDSDPRSSDFGKIKSGNTRWDIWGGFQQYAKVGTQIITGQRVSTNTGRVQELDGEGAFGSDRSDVVGGFTRGKLAPVPSMAWDLIKGRNIVGEKIDLTKWGSGVDDSGKKQIGAGEYALTHLAPLTISGIKEGVQDQGAKGFFTVGVPTVFGIGTQTYEAGKNPHKEVRQKATKKKKR